MDLTKLLCYQYLYCIKLPVFFVKLKKMLKISFEIVLGIFLFLKFWFNITKTAKIKTEKFFLDIALGFLY